MKIEELPENVWLKELEITLSPGSNIPESLTKLWIWVMKHSKFGIKVVVTELNGVKVTFEAKGEY